MVVDQSSGVAAGTATKRGIAVQNIPDAILRNRLLAQEQLLTLLDEQKKQQTLKSN